MIRRLNLRSNTRVGAVFSVAAGLLLCSVSTGALAQATTEAPGAPPSAQSQDVAAGDEIVVTGVFAGTQRSQAAAAITTIGEKDIARQAPASAADLLKDVPGAYVNSSVGETRNVVYARGISVGTFQSTTGFYWVSLQEDGLPVTASLFSNFGPDMFYRADITTKRVEAVRGGTAVVTGPNAPGGLFNYISRNGAQDPGAEISVKLGLEGDGSPSYRGDFYLGGALGSGWSGSVGGFYRRSDGVRPAGYPFNDGGQIKANIGYDYGSGNFLIYGKYLNDLNGTYDTEYLPTRGYADPQLRPGLKRTDSYLPPLEQHNYPIHGGDETGTWDPSQLARYTSVMGGIKWVHDFDGGWEINTNAKIVNNRARAKFPNGTIRSWGLANRDLYGNLGLSAAGLTNQPGATIYLRDRDTGALRAQIVQTSSAVWNVVSNNLPSALLGGDPLFDNSVLAGGAFDQINEVRDIMALGTITKRSSTLTFSAGMYFADSKVKKDNFGAGGYIMPLEDRPTPLAVSLQLPNGTLYQLTSPQGYGNLGAAADTLTDRATQQELSFFGGLTWTPITSLTVDLGVRHERFSFSGSNIRTAANANAGSRTFGGLDGDPLTLYDNLYARYLDPISFAKDVSFTNYSGALSWRFAPGHSVYVRASRGLKNPDNFYNQYDNAIRVQQVDPVPPIITQYELGYNYAGGGLNLSLTPFYTILDRVSSVGQGIDENGTRYYTDPAYSKYKAYGVEIEASYRITPVLSARLAMTVQGGKTVSAQQWSLGGNGRADDVLTVQSGKLENNAGILGNATLTYDDGGLHGFVSTRYMGERPVAITSPYNFAAYTQTDLGIGYQFTEHFDLSLNVNNVFNDFGVLNVSGPNVQFGRTLTTAEIVAQYPDANTHVLAIQPRSFWLSANYKF